jgi:Zn-dependent M16 (insulinase) family peptidase
MLTGKSTKDKIPQLFDLFHEILCEAQLDNQKRAVEMLKESKSRRESSVISSGHSYGAIRIGARFVALIC